ncbi:hypothetical protein BH20ACT2_BH20ACT2_24970 [soil metagenome]
MTPERATTRRGRCRGDIGSGLIPSIAGVVVFLACLLFAVQLLFNLYATSAVTSATYDAAREVAGAAIDHRDRDAVVQASLDAERNARRILGGYSSRIDFEWVSLGPDEVELRVQADNPRFLWAAIDGPLGFDEIDRTVTVRVEKFR